MEEDEKKESAREKRVRFADEWVAKQNTGLYRDDYVAPSISKDEEERIEKRKEEIRKFIKTLK